MIQQVVGGDGFLKNQRYRVVAAIAVDQDGGAVCDDDKGAGCERESPSLWSSDDRRYARR